MDQYIVNVVEQVDEVTVVVEEQTPASTLSVIETLQTATLTITEVPSEVTINIVEAKDEIVIEVGSPVDLFYEHNQLVPLSVWIIEHNLGKYPSVTIVDSAGTVVFGDIFYDSEDQVTITFGSGFSGKAFLN